jgi:hypothetical protein
VKNGIASNADLQARTAIQLLSLRGFGPGCLVEVEHHVERLGLGLAPPVIIETDPDDFMMLRLRTRNRLAEVGIVTSEELRLWSATELLSLHGFGCACLSDVQQYLERLGLRLAPERCRRSRLRANGTNRERRGLVRQVDPGLRPPLRATGSTVQPLRRLIRKFLKRDSLVRGTQSRLAKRFDVSKQRIHQLVLEERDRQERRTRSAR